MYEPAGRYEDILSLIARAELPYRGDEILKKSFFGRACVEPAFQIFGLAINALFRALPADTALGIEHKLYRSIVGDNPTYPLADSHGALARARSLGETVERETGKKPAMLALLAHPPVNKELLYLNVELFRHSLWGIREARGRPCRPKLVNAMDAFALDLLPSYAEGAYGGMMSSYHLGFDRIPNLRSGSGSVLLRQAGWPSMAGRVRRTLEGGGEMIMVLGGGVETTARLFYALRERVGYFCRNSPRRSTPERTGTDRFVKSHWRAFERGALEAAVSEGGYVEIAAGRLPNAVRRVFAEIGSSLGYGDREIEKEIKELEEEFPRATPYRKRFFRFLANKVVRSGRPVLIMPLTLGEPGKIEIRWSEPIVIETASGPVENPLLQVRGLNGVSERAVDEFSKEFVKSEFN